MNEAVLRVARPTDRLEAIARMYREGLGLSELSRFTDHQGFDGIILGHLRHPWHLEFTHRQGERVGRAPTSDNLLVFYIPEAELWQAACERMLAAGFSPVASTNPYWDKRGRTFEDPDGYRVVLERDRWSR